MVIVLVNENRLAFLVSDCVGNPQLAHIYVVELEGAFALFLLLERGRGMAINFHRNKPRLDTAKVDEVLAVILSIFYLKVGPDFFFLNHCRA